MRGFAPSLAAPALLIVLAFAGGCADEPHSPVGVSGGVETVLAATTCELHGTDELVASHIASMKAAVDALADGGAINAGQAQALHSHLDNALRQLDRGQTCAAEAQLEAFRNQLEELVGGGTLSDREAWDLRHATRVALSGQTHRSEDPEAYAPGATGDIRTVVFEGEEMKAEVIDGLAIFNGDIILGFADELTADPDAGPSPAGACHGCTRWSGSIGFSYADDWGDPTTNAEVRTTIVQAVNHLRARTGLEFEERTTGERVVFRNSMGCSSMVGRQVVTGVEPQYINLGSGCRFGSTVHEILHALGIWHEHNRNDRDDYVDVDFSLVSEGTENNYEQYGGSGTDLGPYDPESIMHYPCGAITPAGTDITCDDLGQRDSLTVGDIAGTYYLHPPQYRIAGATTGDVADRFTLSAVFDTEPVRDDFIRWSALGTGTLGTGPTFSTLDAGLTEGAFTIYADILIGGLQVARRFVEVTIHNTPPSVDLGPDRNVELNRTFSVVADVTDAEDGACRPPVCSYEWSPVPLSDRGVVADYRYAVLGARDISVTVTDGAGLTGKGEVTVIVVDSPPTPVISSPSAGSTFSSGAVVPFSGFATDPNVGPGPEDGELPCERLHWTSSDLSDLVSPRDDCSISITFGNPGSRTITLRATDLAGQMESTSILVHVEGCGATGCPPDVVLEFDTPSDLSGSQYSPSFTGPGYLLDTPIEMKALVTDIDGPPTVVALEWEVTPPCLGTCSPFVIGTTGVFAPNVSFLTWTPSHDIDPWSNCVLGPLPFVIRVTATDGNGNMRTASRTVHLACDLI